jgi:hypothetical protein
LPLAFELAAAAILAQSASAPPVGGKRPIRYIRRFWRFRN